MERTVMKKLEAWKRSPFRKPLVVQGARQVGKTYTLLEFGKRAYENIAYFNFETDPRYRELFDESIAPDYLVPLLSRASQQTITTEKTLIVFDEVQLCERALTSLKYFCEQAPAYHVAVAGSLLGIAVNREAYSFPVGKVDMLTMHPMDMEEFLLAMGDGELAERIRRCYERDEPLPSLLHQAALERYREYLLVGGMPECVLQYAQTQNHVLVRHTQETILMSYLADMSKYNSTSENKKTRLVYDNISVQLSRDNTRFQYKLVKKGGRAAEFENAIEWLKLSGIAGQVFRVEQARKPLENYRDIDAFKLYVSDTGLLAAKENLEPVDVLYGSHDLDDFRGGQTENYAYTQMNAHGYSCYYWKPDRGAEVDFVIQREGAIVPVEVKSSDGKAKSLHLFMGRYRPPYAVKLCARNFGFEGDVKTVPLYAAYCL